MELESIEYILNEEKDESGVYAISLVSAPAIESTFVNLNEHKVEMKLIDEERGILLGAALIPDKKILRRGAPDYYIWFSKDTVRRTSELFMERSHHQDTTLEHEFTLDGNTIVETWIKESEQDKSVFHGIDAPIGTWFVAMKIENEEILAKAKRGELNGFSIEGLFDDTEEKTEGDLSIDEQILEEINDIIKTLTHE